MDRKIDWVTKQVDKKCFSGNYVIPKGFVGSSTSTSTSPSTSISVKQVEKRVKQILDKYKTVMNELGGEE